MQKLLKQLRPYWKQLVIVLVLLLIQAVGNLYLPDLNADIINNGIARGDTDYILSTGALMLGVTALLALSTVITTYLSAHIAMGFGERVRGKLFRKVQSFSKMELDAFGTSSLITRNTNDVQQVQMLIVMGINMMVLAPIMCVGGIIMAIRQDVSLSFSLVIILPVMAALIFMIMRKAMPLFGSMQDKLDRLNLVVREKLSGLRVIRAFVKTDFEAKRYDEANTDLTTTAMRVTRLMAVAMPSMMLIFNFSVVGIMWFGAMRIDSGAMPMGNLSAFINYIVQILMSVMMAIMMVIFVPRASVSARRINEVLSVRAAISSPADPKSFGPLKGSVEFRGVSFAYPGAESPVLKNLSFTLSAGETTAIIGSTGSGKSTLVNLIPRYYDVTEGEILIDGVDARETDLNALREKIGLVPQKAYLFSGTIAENLRYGDSGATGEALWSALDIAQAKKFVSKTPDQLDAHVAQGGSNFSGGQRQRLSIARALVKKPEIYIFDDSFSALDARTDIALRAALKAEVRDACVIIVGQRVASIMNADRIIVLEEGEIVGMGVHKELMKSCSVYEEIVRSQLRKEEI